MFVSEQKIDYAIEYLRDNSIICHADEYGLQLEYRWGDIWCISFVPWGYEVTVNDEGYPEVKQSDAV